MTRDRPTTPPDRLDPARIRRAVLADHRETLLGVLEAADAVAADWTGGYATDRSAVSGPLERQLDRRGLRRPLVAVLETAAAAAGVELGVEPVPAPPYLAITGRGPLLRGTVDGGRILVSVAAFAVERNPVRYVRTGDDPASVLEVTVRS